MFDVDKGRGVQSCTNENDIMSVAELRRRGDAAAATGSSSSGSGSVDYDEPEDGGGGGGGNETVDLGEQEAIDAFVLVDAFERLDGVGRMRLHLGLLGCSPGVGECSEDGDVNLVAMIGDGGERLQRGVIAARTQMHFVHRRHNVVLALDLTPSMASISPHRGAVLIDQMLLCVERCIRLVLRPVALGDERLDADVLLSVVGHGAAAHPFRALLLCWPLTSDNVDEVIRLIHQRVSAFENELARARQDPDALAVVDLSVMLASTLFCIDRMPPERCPIAFFLTDGVVGNPEGGAFENVYASLARKDVVVHTVLVSCSRFHAEQPFGFVHEADALSLLAQHSGGVFLEYADLEQCSCASCQTDMSLADSFPHACACGGHTVSACPTQEPKEPPAFAFAADWPVRPCLLSGLMFRHSPLSRHRASIAAVTNTNAVKPAAPSCFPWTGVEMATPLLSFKLKEYVLDVGLSALLQCRVREGFKDGRIVDAPDTGITITYAARGPTSFV